MEGEINSLGRKPRAGQAPYSAFSLKWCQGRGCWLPPWLRAALHALQNGHVEFWEWRERAPSDLELWVREPQGLGVPCWPALPPATQQEFWAPRAPPRQDPRGEKRSPNLEKQSDLLKNV